MQSAGQIESLACEVVNRFMQHMVGRGASDMKATLMPGLLLVHLRDVLTTAEATLTRISAEDGRGADSLVRAMRDHIVRQGRVQLATALAEAIGRQPAAVLHDVDPDSGNEVLVFTFAAPPNSPKGDAAASGHAMKRLSRSSA